MPLANFIQRFSPMRRRQRFDSIPAATNTRSMQNSTSHPAMLGVHSTNTTPRRTNGVNNNNNNQFTKSQPPKSVSMKGLSQQLAGLNMDGFSTEKFDQNDISYDTDGSILSGSVSALIHRLLPTRNSTPESQFIFTLIVNIRTIISPQELMQKIVQNSMFSQNEDVSRHGRERMFAHIFRLCHEWVTTIPHDFRTEYMRTRLNELLTLCSVDTVYRKKAADLQASLKATLNKFERYEKAMENLQKKVDEGQPPQPIDLLTGILPLCQNPKEVAQQLAHIEFERMSMIGIDEIVHALAHNQLLELGKLNGLNSATSAITFYIDWFNRLSSFAATEVLRHTKRRHRVQVIEYLIDVARECCEIGNFNSLMAIVAGLSLPCVARLKRTWCRVDKQKLQILQHQIDPSGNFVSYRATLKAAQWRAEIAKTQDEKTIIPFFVLLLKDLYMIYHGSMRILPNGHLNFVAFTQLAALLSEFHEWKRTQCVFPKNPQVLHYLLVAKIYAEKQSELMSFECEQPDNCDEREQWKKLKSKLDL